MIFSKPIISSHYYYSIYRKRFPISKPILNGLISRNILFHNQNNLSKIYLNYNQKDNCLLRLSPRTNNLFFNNFKIFHYIKRDFKSRNSYVNVKQGYVGSFLEKLLLLICIVGLSSFFIDFRFIWEDIVPPKFRDPFTKADKAIKEWARKNLKFKKADSLAAEGADSETEEHFETTLQKYMSVSGYIHKFLAVFSFSQDFKTDGFRNRRIIEYENRIRLYSNPDKIFRYFATLKIVYGSKESEIFMTPHDFLRSLTPGMKQPDGFGLDQFQVIDLTKSINDDYSFEMNELFPQHLSAEKEDTIYCKLKSDSIFYKLSKNGLINFSDFLFLLTVISVSSRHFEIAFKMFDLNNDGEVEYAEFAKVQNAILCQTRIGKKMGKAQKYKGVSSAVSKYFFGPKLKQRLTIDRFLEFQESLQNELLTLEFERKHPDPKTGRIREVDFADLLVAYALLSDQKRQQMNQRVKNRFGLNNSEGISIDDFLHFFHFLRHINDVDIALAIYHIAGASIDQATLKRVAKNVAHVDLSDHLVDVVFTIFDEDEDGQLSHREFVAIMKERLRRGLQKPKDTGFMALIRTIWKSLISFQS